MGTSLCENGTVRIEFDLTGDCAPLFLSIVPYLVSRISQHSGGKAPFARDAVGLVRSSVATDHAAIVCEAISDGAARVVALLAGSLCTQEEFKQSERSAMYTVAMSMARTAFEACVSTRADAWSQVIARRIGDLGLPVTQPVREVALHSIIPLPSLREALTCKHTIPQQCAMQVASYVVDCIVAVAPSHGDGCNSVVLISICELIVASLNLCSIAETGGAHWVISATRDRDDLVMSGLCTPRARTQTPSHLKWAAATDLNNSVRGVSQAMCPGFVSGVLASRPAIVNRGTCLVQSTATKSGLMIEGLLQSMYLIQLHMARNGLSSGADKGILVRATMAVSLYGILISRLGFPRSCVADGLAAVCR